MRIRFNPELNLSLIKIELLMPDLSFILNLISNLLNSKFLNFLIFSFFLDFAFSWILNFLNLRFILMILPIWSSSNFSRKVLYRLNKFLLNSIVVLKTNFVLIGKVFVRNFLTTDKKVWAIESNLRQTIRMFRLIKRMCNFIR
jgi:hypothetical protein